MSFNNLRPLGLITSLMLWCCCAVNAQDTPVTPFHIGIECGPTSLVSYPTLSCSDHEIAFIESRVKKHLGVLMRKFFKDESLQIAEEWIETDSSGFNNEAFEDFNTYEAKKFTDAVANTTDPELTVLTDPVLVISPMTQAPVVEPTSAPVAPMTEAPVAAMDEAPIVPSVTKFVLYNADTHTKIRDMHELETLYLLDLPKLLTIVAVVDPPDFKEHVKLTIDPNFSQTESFAPYALAGDDYRKGTFVPATEQLKAGDKTLTAKPFRKKTATTTYEAYTSLSIHFQVVNSHAPPLARKLLTTNDNSEVGQNQQEEQGHRELVTVQGYKWRSSGTYTCTSCRGDTRDKRARNLRGLGVIELLSDMKAFLVGALETFVSLGMSMYLEKQIQEYLVQEGLEYGCFGNGNDVQVVFELL